MTTRIHITNGFRRYDKNLRVPDVGKFGQLLHDWQLEEYNYGLRVLRNDAEIAYPSTRQFRTAPSHVEMSEPWQRWYFALISYVAGGYLTYAELLEVWRATVGDHVAFTDDHAPENGRADYITRRNLGAKPLAWATLGMTGNLVKILDRRGETLLIEALDVSKPPPSVHEALGKPWLVHWATEQRNFPVAGGYVVSNFPQLEIHLKRKGFPAHGLPVPVMSANGTQTAHMSYIQRVQNGAEYDVYYP
jgi:hypothetical protein